MPYDFPQFAELWREQIDPDELRRLQAMASKIERTARRKHLFDLAMAVVAIGLMLVFVWVHPASLPIRLGFALIVAVVIGRGWRRYQITKASRVVAIHDPRMFFRVAIKNMRSEIAFSTISLGLAVLAILLAPLLMYAARGLNSFDLILRAVLEVNFKRKILAAALFILPFAYYVRENVKLREQLRRLEGMSREWDRQEAGDSADGPDDTPIPE